MIVVDAELVMQNAAAAHAALTGGVARAGILVIAIPPIRYVRVGTTSRAARIVGAIVMVIAVLETPAHARAVLAVVGGRAVVSVVAPVPLVPCNKVALARIEAGLALIMELVATDAHKARALATQFVVAISCLVAAARDRHSDTREPNENSHRQQDPLRTH